MHERPFAISAVCVLGTLAACYTAVLLLNTRMWAVPPTTGERAVALGVVAVAVAALYGMWRMRRWGVLLLATAIVARIAYTLVAHQRLHVVALVGPGVVLVVGLVYVRRMT
jgi:hypothetical protein